MEDKTSRGSFSDSSPEDLPYKVELWRAEHPEAMERVLGRAVNSQLARAIFKAAVGDHPERRITLRKGSRIIADSSDSGARD